MDPKALLLPLILLLCCGAPTGGPSGGSAGGGEPITMMNGGGSEATAGGSEGTAGGTSGTAGGSSGTAGGSAAPTGLTGFCQHYKDCGGNYYSTAMRCEEASLNYWGRCATRRAALDAYGTCMLGVSCSAWGNPDAYNPVGGPCASQWSALRNTPACP
jgi:hypothetical protein